VTAPIARRLDCQRLNVRNPPIFPLVGPGVENGGPSFAVAAILGAVRRLCAPSVTSHFVRRDTSPASLREAVEARGSQLRVGITTCICS
jgi:hypothetical protein